MMDADLLDAAVSPQFCELHCGLTRQCNVCGCLVHGKTGQQAHEEWHSHLAEPAAVPAGRP